MALLWLPLYRLRYKDEKRQKKACRYAVHLSFKGFIWLMRMVGVVKVETRGLDKLQNLRGKIIIANHPSLIDVVVLISLIRNADCVVKQDLWNNLFISGVIKSSGYLSNADPEGLIEDCRLSLEQGNNLIIFPEGTRTKPDTIPKLRRGAANLALRCQKDLQVVSIHVSPPALTKGFPWYKVPPSKIILQLDVKGELKVAAFQGESITKSVRTLTREIERLFIMEIQQREFTH